MLDKKIMGQRLFAVREAKGVSRKDLAEFLKVTKTQISDIENGKSGTNLDRFYQLCEFYQVSADYLLGITDDPTWRGK
ncbi:MAG: helix-turn-helix transcriptional regulator [Lawsonibacter sp.]|nr:helix-turn-helix transcriptional regulator [Lawsonibacter sp.]